jgi:hypothetical protein
MALFNVEDLAAIEKEAQDEINTERQGKAKSALKTKMRQREAALQIVANIDSEIRDLKASISDGSFTG